MILKFLMQIFPFNLLFFCPTFCKSIGNSQPSYAYRGAVKTANVQAAEPKGHITGTNAFTFHTCACQRLMRRTIC